jgi:hypothetical protein
MFFLLANSLAAQSSVSTKPSFEDGERCESVKAYLDYVHVEAGNDKMIFLVARLGDGESSRRLNRRRSANIYRYLTATRRIPRERIVKVEGERMRGNGRVEVYVGGSLIMVFTLKRGREMSPWPGGCGEG